MPLGPSTSVVLPASSGCSVARAASRVGLQRQLDHLDAHRAIRRQPLARRAAAGRSILFSPMQVGMPACSAAISARVSCDSLNTGSPATSTSSWSRLAAKLLVRHSSWRNSRLRRGSSVLDDAFVAGEHPAHAVADDEVALLAARVAQHARAVGCLDDHVAAVGGHHQAGVDGAVGAVVGGQASSASTLAAQMKSLIEMPPTECVLKRTRAAVVAEGDVGVVVVACARSRPRR